MKLWVKVEAPKFDGSLDLYVLIDWLANLENYFDWYDMANTRCVHFVIMKLVGLANCYLLDSVQLSRLFTFPFPFLSLLYCGSH